MGGRQPRERVKAATETFKVTSLAPGETVVPLGGGMLVLPPGMPVPMLLDLDTPWRGDGQLYDWCQGCDRTPNRALMGWTEGALYRCRDCRAVVKAGGEGTPQLAPHDDRATLTEIYEQFEGFFTEPASAPHDWGSSAAFRG